MRADAYKQSLGIETNPESEPAVPIDAARYNLKQSWLKSTITQELLTKFSTDADSLEKLARALACTYAQHQNHINIVNTLIRADELRKVIEYAKACDK